LAEPHRRAQTLKRTVRVLGVKYRATNNSVSKG